MSVREIDALCYERGIEFDPAQAPAELAEMATMVAGQPAWEGISAEELAERRWRERVPDWFSAEDLLLQPWERVALEVA
jgi:hypothetical protein